MTNNYFDFGPDILPARFDLDRVVIEWGCVNVFVSNAGNTWNIFFDGFDDVQIYNETDMSYYYFNSLDLPSRCGIFKLIKSIHLKWFKKMSLHGRAKNLQNFVIMCLDDVVDIISDTPPEIILVSDS